MARLDDPDTYTNYVELVPLRGELVDKAAANSATRLQRARAWIRQHRLALIVVGIPTVLALLYFGLIAADRYETEAKFVVRTPSRENVNILSSALQGTGLTVSSDDAHAVHAFIRSRDALQLLVERADLRAILSRPEADPIWRYPNFYSRDRTETLFKHYLDFVTIEQDRSTGISTLTVQAFRPDDAVRIAKELLDAGERLINRLNERARSDTVQTATDEVERAQNRANASREALTAFRTRETLVDPTRTSVTILESIAKLSFEVAQVRAQLTEVQRSSPDSPQIPALRNRISALEGEITRERLKLGGGDGALAPRIAEYERLILEREFADRALASALNSLELARSEAQRQQLYLERIVEPNAPDYPRYPRRFLAILLVLGVAYGVFRVLRAFIDNVLRHQPY